MSPNLISQKLALDEFKFDLNLQGDDLIIYEKEVFIDHLDMNSLYPSIILTHKITDIKSTMMLAADFDGDPICGDSDSVFVVFHDHPRTNKY